MATLPKNIIALSHLIGDIVFLITDNEQSERMIIEILIKPDGIMYQLAKGDFLSWHYDIEFTKDRDVLKATTN